MNKLRKAVNWKEEILSKIFCCPKQHEMRTRSKTNLFAIFERHAYFCMNWDWKKGHIFKLGLLHNPIIAFKIWGNFTPNTAFQSMRGWFHRRMRDSPFPKTQRNYIDANGFPLLLNGNKHCYRSFLQTQDWRF